MAKYILEPSRTFGEFLLIPGLTMRKHIAANADLTAPLVKFKKGEVSQLNLSVPFVSAAMQSVSGERLAVELAKLGGLAFIYCSQIIESQAKMVKQIKKENVMVGVAVNTHDYKERIPALVEAGADVLCIDSSDGFSQWQKDVIGFVRSSFGDKIKIGAGNVVDAKGFEYLADAGADFVKVGIGGGSICITREQKGIGRGQASAVIDVVSARDKYFERHGIYIPVCSDGGIVYDNHIIMALAMGADFVMMGRYFAQLEESAGKTVTIDGRPHKEYWGEGSARACNWQRYSTAKMLFEEGVDSYIPLGGSLAPTIATTVNKIKSTMCNCGSLTLKEFTKNAVLTVISSASQIEGAAHDVLINNK